MITEKTTREIHSLAIARFGGSDGLREAGLLSSAIMRPAATFDGIELYPSPLDKAAALAESIVKNHPFSDGNKRTGYILMRLQLLESGLDIAASEDEKYDFIIQIAEGKLDYDAILSWLKNRLKIS